MLDTNPKLARLSDTTTTATTNGWDTVYGIRFADVNTAIANAGASPTTYTYDQGTGATRERISGALGAWTLTGGSGHLLEMTLPLDTITLQFAEDPVIKRRQATIKIEVVLDKVKPASSLTHPANPNVVEFRMAGNMGEEDTILTFGVEYPALPAEDDFPAQNAHDADGLIPVQIEEVFAKWLNLENTVGEFDFAFATVNLNQRAAVDKLDWLMPTHASYGIAPNTADDGDGIFAILCMTDGATPPGNQDVSRALLPEGARAGFLISKQKFLQHMVLPGLALSFDDPAQEGKVWPTSYFAVSSNGTRIINTEPLGIADFQIEGKSYAASLEAEQFEVTLEDTHLSLNIDRFKHSFAGFWYDVFHDIRMDTYLSLSDDGKTIDLIPGNGIFDEDDKDTGRIDHYATIEKTDAAKVVEWTVLVIDVLLLFAALGGAFKTPVKATAEAGTQTALSGSAKMAGDVAMKGAAKGAAQSAGPVLKAAKEGTTSASQAGLRWWGSLLAGIMSGMSSIALLENLVQILIDGGDGPEGSIPDVGIFADLVMEPITWPDAADFTLTSVQFNGGMQIGGTPDYAT